MIDKTIKFAALLLFLWPSLLLAGIQGGVELKHTVHDNFNLANGETEPVSESVSTTQVNLNMYKASSGDFVWSLKGIYIYSEYDKYHHLSGSTALVLGGMFYRFNVENSVTVQMGKRERRYDEEDLSLYEDDSWLANVKFMHRLSKSTLMNEKFSYERNDTQVRNNEYEVYSGQLWFEWSVARRTTWTVGYVHTSRNYLNTSSEYTFEQPFTSLSYSLGRNVYTRIGFSKTKMTDRHNDRAYNTVSYLALGFGF